jgi:predicted HTH domain antitoxin
MKYSEVIFSLMDEIRQLVDFINQYIHKGIELFEQARLWIAKAIEYIEARINEFTYRVRNKNVDFLEFSEEDMFV